MASNGGSIHGKRPATPLELQRDHANKYEIVTPQAIGGERTIVGGDDFIPLDLTEIVHTDRIVVMKALRARWTLAAVLVALAAAGCSGPAGVSSKTTPAEQTTNELEAIYRARLDRARTLFTDADANFMTGMIAHHAQAIVMARLAPTHGAGNHVQTLAARIINAQQDEIETMQQWLRDREQPVPEIHSRGTTLLVHGAGDHDMHMPGMLTREQMGELDEARGDDFDRLFLRYMIQHHDGAVTMVENLFSTDGAAQDEETFMLASAIHVDQITEIARMERMLNTLSGAASEP